MNKELHKQINIEKYGLELRDGLTYGVIDLLSKSHPHHLAVKIITSEWTATEHGITSVVHPDE